MHQLLHTDAHARAQGSLSNSRGGPFAVLNGSLVPEVLVVAVPAERQLEGPLFVLHLASGGWWWGTGGRESGREGRRWEVG